MVSAEDGRKCLVILPNNELIEENLVFQNDGRLTAC